MRPILLVGAGGQVGSRLVPLLSALGPVHGVTRANADVRRLDALRELVRATNPRLVVNAAAYTAVDAAEKDIESCWLVNAEAPRVLAEESGRLGVPIVHYSTNYVFDGASTVPYTEDDVARPLSEYGRSKLEGEVAVARANPAHVILRLSAIYDVSGVNFVRRILELARERDELRIVDDQFVSPTPALAVAEATVLMIGLLEPEAFSRADAGVFHLTASGSTSWYGFASEILTRDPRRDEQRCRTLVPITSADYVTPAARPANGVLATTKFEHRFGFGIPSWERELERTLASLPVHAVPH